MQPWRRLERATTPDGKELLLCQRAEEFVIRVDGYELMSSRAHGSEEAMAELAAGCLPARSGMRWLVGGLGLGYTLRAVLDQVSADATIEVAELIPAVVNWNRGPLGHLAGHPLGDPRVRVHTRDVAHVMTDAAADTPYDAILLDVDNGPEALCQAPNGGLYTEAGLAAAKGALRRPGVLAIWSADGSSQFTSRLRRVGFRTRAHSVAARGRLGGPKHTVWTAAQ